MSRDTEVGIHIFFGAEMVETKDRQRNKNPFSVAEFDKPAAYPAEIEWFPPSKDAHGGTRPENLEFKTGRPVSAAARKSGDELCESCPEIPTGGTQTNLEIV